MDRQDLDRTEKTVVEICLDNIDPMVHIVTKKLRIDDKNLLKIEAPRSPFVHKSSNGYFYPPRQQQKRDDHRAVGAVITKPLAGT